MYDPSIMRVGVISILFIWVFAISTPAFSSSNPFLDFGLISSSVPLLWQRALSSLDVRWGNQLFPCIIVHDYKIGADKIEVSRECWDQQLISEMQKQLFSQILDIYIRQQKILEDPVVIHALIKNRFFETSVDSYKNPVDLRQPTQQAARDFFQKTAWDAYHDPSFAEQNPKLYEFLNWTLWSTRRSAPPGVREQILSRITPPPALGRVQLLDNNIESWWARYALLSQAKKSIDIQYFIIDDDVFGKSFLALLLEKAKEGVQIRLMVDRRGTPIVTQKKRKDIFQLLASYGVQIKVFNPFVADFPDINFISSNHDKILLIDDRYFMTGGRNISSYYFVAPQDEYYLFSDTDILVDSPDAAASAKIAFQMDFDHPGYLIEPARNIDVKVLEELFEAKSAMEDRLLNEEISEKTLLLFPKLGQWKSFYGIKNFQLFPNSQEKSIHVIDKNSDRGDYQDLQKEIFSLIEQTQTELLIENPYVVLTPAMKSALSAAGNRGVQITIRTNGPTSGDSAWTQSIFEHERYDLFETIPNLKIFAAKGPIKVHSKLFVFDRVRSIVGSYNLDNLSENINSEIAVVIHDSEISQQVQDTIQYRIDHDSIPYKKDTPFLGDKKARRDLTLRYWVAQILRRWI